MSVKAWPQGVGRVELAQTDTTNAEAARRAAFGTAETWILAQSQTAGRGRRGRVWVSPEGNFYASLLMRPEGGPAEAALRSFVASLALYDALAELTGLPQAFALKWPNDVLLNGAKLSGILLEAVTPAGGGVSALIVGIGVNLIAAPDPALLEAGAVAPVDLLSETGLRISPRQFLDVLGPAFAAREAEFRTQGFAPIRAAWLDRAARLGEQITARVGHATHHGRYIGIDESGALILETAEGRMCLPAADIFF